jgi:LPXTG-motif cell wall-anchored protein
MPTTTHALKKWSLAVVATAAVTLGTPAAFAGNVAPTMQVDPTSGPAGSAATVSSITGCPDTDGVYDVTAYVGDQPNLLTGPSLGSQHLGSAGGNWSIPITIPADAVGSVTLYAQCIGTPSNNFGPGTVPSGESAQAAPGDVVLSTYTPITFTVVAPPTTTTTSTTTTSTSTSTSTTAVVTTTTTTPAAMTAEPSFMYPGESCLIQAHGFAPGSDVTITVYSDPLVIGTFAADANGSIAQSWTVPSGFAAGAHTVVLTGRSIAGAVELSAPITVGSLVQAVTTTAAPSTTAAVVTTSGNLPTTGSGMTQPLVVGAAVLVLGGGAAVAVSRKRASNRR